MVTTLVVTNDFPPRIGGIESFVATVCDLLDHDVVVLTSTAPGAEDHDRRLPFEVVRVGPLLLPTPTQRARAATLLRRTGATRVLFGAAMPLGLMAPGLRRAGARRLAALTHGHESWWASVPGARTLLRRVGDSTDTMSTISDFVEARLRRALSPVAADRLVRLPPPVDTRVFRPRTAPERPRCVALARLVARKNLPHLVRSWRHVVARWPGDRLPELVIVGDGPERGRLAQLAADPSVRGTVRLHGPARGPAATVEQLQRAQVFALPMRTRLGGLDAEGLGLAALEAAACGLPVVVGNSGGAPETVDHGRTGFVVDPDDELELASRLTALLSDPEGARRMGLAGRRRVVERFGRDQAQQILRRMLALP